jgi:hypothetical protein
VGLKVVIGIKFGLFWIVLCRSTVVGVAVIGAVVAVIMDGAGE